MTIKTHERFGQVRTVEQDGAVWYVGRDVSKALGYSRPEKFVARHVKDADKKCVPVRSLHSYHMAPTIILNAHGLSDMCHAASSVDADNILHWLLDDVKVEEKSPVLVPQVFQHEQFGNLRSVIINGVSWFIGKDIAESLEYKNTNEALRVHVDEEDTKKGVAIRYPLGGVQYPLLTNESGIYALIFGSKLPKAKEFKRWVTYEVLPSIRKTGSYSIKGEMSLFPDEEPITEKKTARRRPVPELAFVYVVEFANGWSKIGVAKDLTARMKDLQKETKQEIVRWAASPLMTREDALLLERALKAKFFDRIIVGEFFSAPFEEIKDTLQTSPAERLIALAEKVTDAEMKDKLFAQAAALLIG